MKLHEKRKAEEYAEQAGARSAKRLQEYQDKLWGVIKVAGVSRDERDRLTSKYGENANALREAILAGEAGTEAQKALADYTKKTSEAQDEQKKKTDAAKGALDVSNPALIAGAEAVKTWGDVLKEYGILPLKEKAEIITELLGYEDQLTKMYETGKLDLEEYQKGLKALNDELKELGAATKTQVLPPAGDFAAIMKQAPATINDAAYATGDFDDQLKQIGDTMGVSAATILRELYNIRREMLATLGIFLPAWKEVENAGTTAAKETNNAFSGLYNDVGRGFGNLVKDVLSGAVSLKEGLGRLWDEVKNAFFTMVGEMAAKWALDFIQKVTTGGSDLVSGVTKTVGGLASNVGGIPAGLGTSLATGIGAAVGTFLGSLLTSVEDFIVDPFAVDVGPLGAVLCDGRETVFHGADYDVRCMKREYGWALPRLLDTMAAARRLGRAGLGLSALVESHFGVRLSQSNQRSDWGRRPLSREQIEYAALDTHFLLPLRDLLAGELDAKGALEEAHREFRRIAAVEPRERVFDPEGWRRLKGARELDPVGRKVLPSGGGAPPCTRYCVYSRSNRTGMRTPRMYASAWAGK